MSTTNRWVAVGKVPFGKGVFARQLIPAGTVIGQVQGKIIDDPSYGSSYGIDVGHSLTLEPRSPFRYLNHRCEPNCMLFTQDVEYEDGTVAPSEVYVEAISDIPEGAELTIDYQWSANGAIKCLCDSDHCRGWIVSMEELPQLVKTIIKNTKKQRSETKKKTLKPR